MKKWTLILILLSASFMVKAQGVVGEIISQKQTQKKYLLQQIAALKVYLGYLEKGYKIAHDGTHLIGDIKRGDLNLHTNRFDSLEKVNPQIRKLHSVEKIIRLQRQMAENRQQMLVFLTGSDGLSGSELAALKRRYKTLAEEAGKDLEELELTITDGKLQLTDDERLIRIEKIYAATLDKQAYQNQLNRNLVNLVAGRKQLEQDHKSLRGVYELH